MREWSVATRFFMGVLSLTLLAVVALTLALYLDATRQAVHTAQERTASLSAALAVDPFVIEAVQAPHPTELLQPFAEAVMSASSVDFVTFMDTDRTRYTHRYKSEIGGTFAGPIDEALKHGTVNQTNNGPLGVTIRGITPIYGESGAVVALVSTGVTVEHSNLLLLQRIPLILGIAGTMLVAGAIMAFGIRRYLRRVTFGRGPEQIGQMYAFYDAVLHTVDDGMLLLGRSGDLVLYNDRARELLGSALRVSQVATKARSRRRAPVGELPVELREVLASGETVEDEVVTLGDRVLLVSHRPVVGDESTGGSARSLGTLVVLRDRTELLKLTSELDSLHTMSDALRSQTHEHANRLHTMVTLFELGRGEEAVRFAAADVKVDQELTDRVLESIDEPVLAALLLGKSAQASERGIELSIVADGRIAAGSFDVQDAVTILGNLIDNAMDAAGEQEMAERRWVEIEMLASPEELVVRVTDGGAGLGGVAPEQVLRRGYTKKSDGSGGASVRGVGLALVHQAVRRSGGTLQLEDGVAANEGARFTVVLPTSAADLVEDDMSSERRDQR
ncbi:sensor histidine kinase [Leucobacter viscericola]|uniref:histidine kinase n=1 Tax=Leucobacter viscericola TaxID=2714935 RepID=A0A6G7XDU4_9MICO|nr:sensor histidine kinase [Leucobacter viscericola]QIK62764.1 sensor histidine kinase [Leucobacter viscericola]